VSCLRLYAISNYDLALPALSKGSRRCSLQSTRLLLQMSMLLGSEGNDADYSSLSGRGAVFCSPRAFPGNLGPPIWFSVSICLSS